MLSYSPIFKSILRDETPPPPPSICKTRFVENMFRIYSWKISKYQFDFLFSHRRTMSKKLGYISNIFIPCRFGPFENWTFTGNNGSFFRVSEFNGNLDYFLKFSRNGEHLFIVCFLFGTCFVCKFKVVCVCVLYVMCLCMCVLYLCMVCMSCIYVCV